MVERGSFGYCNNFRKDHSHHKSHNDIDLLCWSHDKRHMSIISPESDGGDGGDRPQTHNLNTNHNLDKYNNDVA